jgi:hypothetical protein
VGEERHHGANQRDRRVVVGVIPLAGNIILRPGVALVECFPYTVLAIAMC